MLEFHPALVRSRVCAQFKLSQGLVQIQFGVVLGLLLSSEFIDSGGRAGA